MPLSVWHLAIAYANANLFMNMGKYGVRNFQVSDVEPQYSFGDYAVSRAVTSVMMIFFAILYLAWSANALDYTSEKTLVILFMCLFKLVDVVEDVYQGNYQQFGRLDVAGKLLTIRIATTLILFGLGVGFLHELLVPLVVSTAYTALFFFGSAVYAYRRYRLPRGQGTWSSASVIALLKECFPLFLATFLLFYIGNAPKYAIDACLGDAEQAYFGFISMPVFVVGLFAAFAYSPIILSLSRMWSAGDVRGFLRGMGKQIGYVVLITLVCDVGTLVAGIPVLGLMYNTDLSLYLVELIVLVSGGGFLALTALFTLGITIQRSQHQLIWGYTAVALLALLVSPLFVESWGITGASWEYFLLMVLLAVWFGLVFIVGVRKKAVVR